MKYCVNCHSRFTLLSRLKSIFKRYGRLECTNCNTVYIVNSKINGRFLMIISLFSLYSVDLIEKYWLINLSTSKRAVIIAVMIMLLGTSTVFWIPYDVVDKK